MKFIPNIKCLLSVFAVLFMFISPRQARAEWNDSIRYHAELNMNFAGGDYTPFWMVSGKYGLSSIEKNNGYLRLGAFKDMDKTRRFTWGAGVDLAVAARFSSVFVVQQLYAEVKYRCLQAMIGQKEIPGPMSEPGLSSGNLLYGNNARPIPQFRVGIFDYADVWGTKGFLGVKGYIAYGAFTDNRWIKSWVNPNNGGHYALSTLYHSKALFLRAGNTRKFPLEFEIGLEMGTQFGGRSYIDGEWFHFPTKFKNWAKAFIPKGSSYDGALDSERLNVEGNFVGTWNFALAWKPADKDWSLKLYYEHFFEDHSMLWIQYPWKDGLWGINAKLPCRWVTDATVEFIYMKDQSSAVYWDKTPEIPTQVSGRDNYYNHGLYNGWQNWGMNIGNPMIISPIYNSDHTMMFKANRMWGLFAGIKGQPTGEISYRLIGSAQKNWGTYGQPFDCVRRTVNLYAEIGWQPERFKGWKGEAAIAYDGGSLVGRNIGLAIRISKTGWLFGGKKH